MEQPNPSMSAPIFIVGANRSGTTLLRLMLNAHPHIAIPEEIVYFGSFMAGIPIENWRRPGLSDLAYRAFVHRFVTESCAPLGLEKHDQLVREIVEAGPHDFRHPYQHVLQTWARRHGKQRWGEKTPGNLFYADVLHEMFPSARFIHIVRDPRAGVNSMLGTSFFPDDVVFNALSRRKFMTEGRAILRRSVPAGQWTEIRYEDLVLAPEEMARKLCTFLGEPFDEAMLSFYETAGQYMKQEAAASFNKAATRPISPASLEKWRKKLQPDQVALIEKVCKAQMEEWGYPLDRPSLPASRRLELMLKLQYWRLQCWRHRKVRHFTVKSPILARFRGRVREALPGA